MKLTQLQISAIKNEVKDIFSKERKAFEKKLQNSPELQAKAKKYYAQFSKLPQELKSYLKNSWDEVTEKKIHSYLISKNNNYTSPSDTEIENKINLFTIDCADLKELYSRLNKHFNITLSV